MHKNSNRFWGELRGLPLWQQWLLPFVIVLVLVCLWGYRYALPRWQTVAQTNDTIQQSLAITTEWLWMLSLQMVLVIDEQQYAQERHALTSLFPSPEKNVSPAQYIIQPLALSGNQLRKWKKLPAIPHSHWVQQPWDLEISGDYASLIAFLHHLLNRPELLLIEKADMSGSVERVRLRIRLSSYQLSVVL